VDISENTAATVEYRCVLVRPRSSQLLAVEESDQHRLPRIHIPEWTRPAEELQKVIRARWELDVLVLETWAAGHDVPAFVVAELLEAEQNSFFVEFPVRQFKGSEFSEEDCQHLESLLEGRTKIPFSRLGWIDEAMSWIESATGASFSSKRNIAQWNAGGGFALLSTCSDDGRRYWLKATGKPNLHEFSITRLLSKSYPDFLPKLVATNTEWNAWLMEDAGAPISDPPSAAELVPAARRMAKFQIQTTDHTVELLNTGAFDQRLSVLSDHIDAVVAYLIEAMARQTSTKAITLSRVRLLELGEILHQACSRLETRNIPDTLIHNDLNPGNILFNGTNCVFTDWSEAAVGNPLVVCERLCRLNPSHRESVQAAYRQCWKNQLSNQTIEEALVWMPLLAIYAYLYGRGDWLARTEVTSPRSESSARSLARHMDRAAREISLLEAPCH
jgi:thiamine kinase-like enzyme